MTKTATVSLHGNHHEVDAALIGRRCELVFDPFDLTDIDVRCQQRSFGPAVPMRVGRHAHPKARPDQPEPAAPTPTGIDYLRLLDAAHTQQLAARINYAALVDDPDAQPDPTTSTDPDQEAAG